MLIKLWGYYDTGLLFHSRLLHRNVGQWVEFLEHMWRSKVVGEGFGDPVRWDSFVFVEEMFSFWKLVKIGGIITWWLWCSMSSFFACLSCIANLAEIIWDWISIREKYSLGFKDTDGILFISRSFPQFSNNSTQLRLYHTYILKVIYRWLTYCCTNVLIGHKFPYHTYATLPYSDYIK